MITSRWPLFLLFIMMSSICNASPNTPKTHGIAGTYAQLQGGIGGLRTKHYNINSDPYDQVSLRNGLAYRLSAGYLLTHNKINYGLELGYDGYPQNKYSFSFPTLPASGVQEYKGNTVDLLAVLKFNLLTFDAHDVYIHGKAGAAYMSQTFNGQSAALGTVFALNKTIRQFKPEVAAGVGYQLCKKIDINVSYHYLFADQANPFADSVVNQNGLTQISSVGLLMAGIAYHFA